MYIYLARHAWAGHSGDPGWADDSLRELTPEGARRFRRVVEALAPRDFVPKQIATSPYIRCRQTAEIIAEHAPGKPEVEELEALEPGSDLEALLEWTAAKDGVDVCWVGHNPDMPSLAGRLIGEHFAYLRFAKGSVAAIRFDDEVQAGAGELCWHVTAKVLGV
jgi:phosphohistidine phosphatase